MAKDGTQVDTITTALRNQALAGLSNKALCARWFSRMLAVVRAWSSDQVLTWLETLKFQEQHRVRKAVKRNNYFAVTRPTGCLLFSPRLCYDSFDGLNVVYVTTRPMG